MAITFESNDKITGLGFKLHYTSEKGEELLLNGLKLIHHLLRVKAHEYVNSNC